MLTVVFCIEKKENHILNIFFHDIQNDIRLMSVRTEY